MRTIPWRGQILEECSVDFLGVRYCKPIVNEGSFEGPKDDSGEAIVQTTYPDFNEEYFEWIDLLEATAGAKNRFVMIELGAGFGRWLVRGFFAARQFNGLPCTLIGLEAEPHHFRLMLEHFKHNGIDPARQQILDAAVSATNGFVWFMVGQSDSWYGQRIADPSEVEQEAGGPYRQIL